VRTVGAKFKTGKRMAVLCRLGRKLCKTTLWVLKIDRGSAYQAKFMDKKDLSWIVKYREGTSS